MRFVSDPVKERKNIRKHGLDFSAAKEVFDDPLAATIYDRNQDGEDRYWQVGMANFRLLVVVFSHPDPDDEDLVRIISLREATARERRDYEGKSKKSRPGA